MDFHSIENFSKTPIQSKKTIQASLSDTVERVRTLKRMSMLNPKSMNISANSCEHYLRERKRISIKENKPKFFDTSPTKPNPKVRLSLKSSLDIGMLDTQAAKQSSFQKHRRSQRFLSNSFDPGKKSQIMKKFEQIDEVYSPERLITNSSSETITTTIEYDKPNPQYFKKKNPKKRLSVINEKFSLLQNTIQKELE